MRASAGLKTPLELERLYSGSDHCAARYGSVFVLIAREEPTPALLERQRQWLENFPRERARQSGFVVVLRPEAPPPSDRARSVIHRFYSSFSQHIQAGAMVIEGTGFQAAALRSVTSVIAFAARYPYPIKAFGSVREAAAWLDTKLDRSRSWGAGDLCSAVTELRESYAAQA